jgi:Zeta toxin
VIDRWQSFILGPWFSWPKGRSPTAQLHREMIASRSILVTFAAFAVFDAAGLLWLGSSHAAAADPAQSPPAAEATGDFAVDPQILAAADEAIREPASDDEIPALLAAIERHPYYQEVIRRLKPLRDLEQGGTAQRHKNPDGSYTPERAKLHEGIVAKMLDPAAKAKAGRKPIAILVVGLPGSGKTTVVSPWPKRLDIVCTEANSDDIQNQLPEYQGWNADLLHIESRDILEKMLIPRAIAQGQNLLVDVTGRDPTRTRAIADALGRANYEIYLIHVHLPAGKAAFRAWRRFRGGAFKPNPTDPDSGRFVSPRFIATTFGSKPAETYAALKKHPAVVHWLSVSTSGGRGQPPKLEEEGPTPLPAAPPPAGK